MSNWIYMSKAIFAGVFAFILALAFSFNVSAHHYDYNTYDHYGNGHFSYHYDNYYGGAEIYVSVDDQNDWNSWNYDYDPYYDYNPLSYYDECYSYDRSDLRWEKNPVCDWIEDGDGWREDYKRYQAVNYVVDSYNARYFANYGEKSKNVYCKGCETDSSSTSFGNREIYNPYVHGKGSYRTGNYYDPEFDEEKGYWNWRY